MKKYLQIAILIIISSTVGFSQDSGTNQERLKKYWYLRWRLNNYFMVVGDGYGMSLPAAIRNSWADPQKIKGDSLYSKSMGFGDAPNYLGTYIGILATEYALLSANFPSASGTLTELYYAIKAINRLDECEGQYPWTGTNALDGLCSRGDVDTGFVREHSADLNKNLNNFSPLSPGDPSMEVLTGSHYTYPINPITTEIRPYDSNDIKNDKSDGVMSQDHISSILVGLALVKKFVPAGTTVNGMDLHNEAQFITKRLIDYMQNNGWVLKNPDGDNVILDWGGSAHLFSYGFGKAATFIWPQKAADFLGPLVVPKKVVWDALATSFLGATDFANWTGICDKIQNEELSESCDNSGNAWIMLNLAAVGNSWESVVLTNSLLLAPALAPVGVACLVPGLDCTQGLIWGHSKIYGWEAYYPLLHATLHNSGCLTSRETIEADLNSMPCNGHWGDNGPAGWSTPNKYHQIPTVQNIGDAGFAGQYSGLEFMLLHNLYYLHGNNKDSEGNTLPAFIKMPITSSIDACTTPPTCTSNSDLLLVLPNFLTDYLPGATIAAKNKIVTAGFIFPLDGQTWRANVIEINPGFETLPGQTWTAESGDCIELFGRLANQDTSDSGKGRQMSSGHLSEPAREKETKANKTDTTQIAGNVQASVNNNLQERETKNQSAVDSRQSAIVRGKSEESAPQSTIANKQSPISIAPNPSPDSKFILNCTMQEVGCMEAEISVMNALGQTISKEPMNRYPFPISIDLSSQPKGTYFIKIQNAERVFVEKVVTQ